MIEIRNLSFQYEGQLVFSDYHLEIPEKVTSILTGPSGIGKTTLLRLLAGLEKPLSGSIHLTEPEKPLSGSIHIEGTPRIAFLFQEPRLLPWLTAADNLRLVLPKGRRNEEAIAHWLSEVELSDAAGKFPSELSGGMQQRLALARFLAFSRDCDLLLMDEPFKGLDLPLHERMAALVRKEAAGKTLVLVSHDPEDAARLGASELTL